MGVCDARAARTSSRWSVTHAKDVASFTCKPDPAARERRRSNGGASGDGTARSVPGVGRVRASSAVRLAPLALEAENRLRRRSSALRVTSSTGARPALPREPLRCPKPCRVMAVEERPGGRRAATEPAECAHQQAVAAPSVLQPPRGHRTSGNFRRSSPSNHDQRAAARVVHRVTSRRPSSRAGSRSRAPRRQCVLRVSAPRIS
jgi:hypothetical protein